MKTPLELPALSALILTPVLLLGGCEADSLTRPSGDPIEIVVHVMGGVAGADYTLRVDGERRVLEGLTCVNLCDFQFGDILAGLSPEQLLELRNLALDGGLGVVKDRNYGTRCCDFFLFDIRYSQGDHEAHVVGDGVTLPDPVWKLAERIRAMAQGTFPTLVALDTGRDAWAQDALTLHSAELAGGFLDVDVSYSGGCGNHDLDLVVFGGFMESEPVRVRAALVHDDRGDACDALVRRELRFDLTPLNDAYQKVYPGSIGGPLTLILEHPGDGQDLSFTYSWARTS